MTLATNNVAEFECVWGLLVEEIVDLKPTGTNLLLALRGVRVR